MKNVFYYETQIGVVGISDNGHAITGVFFPGTRAVKNDVFYKALPDSDTAQVKETPLIKEAASQIYEYLAGKRKKFDIPLYIKGTPFQQAVWKALMDIPYGETRTYKEIAESIGNPKAYRAVGMANNKNPVAIIVPCHRVIGMNGKMVGYAGGLDIKKKLLDLEKMSNSRFSENSSNSL